MKVNKKTVLSVLILSTALVAISSVICHRVSRERTFECRARVQSKFLASKCKKDSVFDIFLSMYGDGRGDVMISGCSTFQQGTPQQITDIVKFTYQKNGNYYSLQLGKRAPELVRLFDILKNDDLKLKITRIDNRAYILSTPVQTLMICTKED